MSKRNSTAQAANRKEAKIFRDTRRAALARKHGFLNLYSLAD